MVIAGVIRPPPEIRAVADRTALHVAKHGRAFEQKILASERGKTPKFAFLLESSPFHAYYEERVQFYEKGGVDEEKTDEKNSEEEKKVNDESKLKEEKSAKASAIDPVARAVLSQRAKIKKIRADYEKSREGDEANSANIGPHIPPPPTLHLVNIVAPSSLTLAQLVIMQLIAQLTALDGKQASFLPNFIRREWNNPEFGFCQARHAHFPYFSALVDAYKYILSEWTSSSSKQEDNVQSMAGDVNYCLDRAAYRAEYQRDNEEHSRDVPDEPVQLDWHDFVVVETIDFPADEKVITIPPPPPSQPKVLANMDESDDEEEETIRVVPSYTPKVATKNEEAMVIDPITGKSVSIKDMPEHMRIQLLDPKWAEERKKFQEKQKDTNLVSGEMVASNLARFTQSYGKNEEAQSRDGKRRLQEANRVIREHTGPLLPTQLPFEEPAVKRTKTESMTIPVAPPSEKPTNLGAPVADVNSRSLPSTEIPFADAATAAASLSHIESAAPGLLPETEFIASLSKADVTLMIRIPNDPTQMAWNFYGQIVSLSINVRSTIKSVKQEISKTHLNGMPANKIQLKYAETGAFLKDSNTLAALNIGPTATLELIPKTRGGRKAA